MDFWTAIDQSQAVERAERRSDRFRLPRAATIFAVAFGEAGLVFSLSLLDRFVFQFGSGRWVGLDTACGIGIIAAVLQATIGQVFGLYDFSALVAPHLRRVTAASVTVILLLTANLFVLKAGADVSRGFLLSFGSLLVVALGLERLALGRLLTRCVAGHLISGRPAVLIGTSGELEHLPSRDLFRQFGITEIARVTVPEPHPEPHLMLERAAAEAVRLARTLDAEELVVASPWAKVDQLTQLEKGLRLSPLPVRLLPDASARMLMARYGPARGPKLVDLQRAPVGSMGLVAKRALDILVASVALIVLIPLLAAAALAVRFGSPGPVLFRQRRNGFDQRTFVIFKFRTMSVMEDHGPVVQVRRDDARVTRVGRVLRRTSIDELPQLLNVLRGEMAIVGPRPHALAHDSHFSQEIDDYCVRHHVKPGITGWAQVNGLRGETRDADQMQRRVAHDLWYIDNWSLTLDLRILLRTCREVLAHDAY